MSEMAGVQRALNDVGRSLDQLARQNQVVIQNTQVISAQQDVMRADLDTLRQEFSAFVAADIKAKQLQLAETRLVSVRQELERTYGHYGEVRRLSTGALQALDAGIVTHTSIQNVTEELMLTTPRYWLAPALVALGAWIRDDRDLADKALAEALTRDSDKVALFFTLVTRRYRRAEASAQWLDTFLSRQDPANLDREFVILLDAIAVGAFGPQAKVITNDHIREWVSALEQRAGFTQEQVRRWRSALAAFTPPAPAGFDHLRTYAADDWPRLQHALASAGLHDLVINHFRQVFDGPLPSSAGITAQVDGILDRLVSEFDTEELPLRREETLQELIIREGGDVTRAQTQFATVAAALEEKNELLTLITNAALFPERSGSSRATQRLATAMSKEWLVEAYDGLTAESRAGRPTGTTVKLDGFSCALGENHDENSAVQSARDWVEKRKAEALAAVKLQPLHYIAAGAAILLAIIGFVFWPMFLLAIACGAYTFFGWRGLDKRRAVVSAEAAARAQSMEAVIRACNAEVVDLIRLWDTKDAQAEEARALLAGISPEQFSLHADDVKREVLR